MVQVELVENGKQLMGEDHPDTLTCMAHLASTYKELGRLNEAEALELEVMEKCKQLHGDDHPYTIQCIGNPGWMQ